MDVHVYIVHACVYQEICARDVWRNCVRLAIVTWTVCIEICLYLSEQKAMSAGNEILNSHYGLHTSTTCIGLG